MGGDIPLLLLYAFMAWTAKTSYFLTLMVVYICVNYVRVGCTC
jgi:hypothetical protein